MRLFSTSTTAFKGKTKLEAVETVEVKWGPGRRITPVKGTGKTIPADVVLIAMGYAHPTHTLVHTLGLTTDRRGSLETPVEGLQAWRTACEGVFAAGDGRSGQSLVVNAVAEGRQCAEAVNRWLEEKRGEAAPLWR